MTARVTSSPSSSVVLRFVDGLVVRPSDCPRGIQAYPHWRRSDQPTEPGEPNAVCACLTEEDRT